MSDTQASDARSEANRANAQHSTGPRTPEGKARSSRNAVKHGLFSDALGYAAKPLGEDRDQFDKLLDGLRRDHAPVGFDENQIVDRMADLWWELARAHRLGQQHLRARLDQGLHMVDVMKELAVFGAEQSRIERSLTRQRKDLWLLQGRHEGAVHRASRKALTAYNEMIAADQAETAAIRARMQAAEAAPHLPASSPEGEEGTHESSPRRRPEVRNDPTFSPEFTDESLPEGPPNGSGHAPGNGAGSGD
jgi:hypothetical protein